MISAKKQAQKVLRHLPPDCSLEDIQYHLYVAEKIRRRIGRADEGKFVPQDEAEKRLAKWLIK